jgi:SecD/SecF fusion protein
MFLSLAAVVIYIWARFGSVRYGLAAIAALVHDVTIALGAIAITGRLYNDTPFIRELLGLDPFRIDLAMIAAMLTIVGYSLNDTIVVFDRIRENKGRLARPTRAIINRSINETVSRTALTSVTTLLALVTLYNFGGHGSVHGFAYAMIVGVAVGTYSSIGVASSLLGIKKDAEPEKTPAIPER